MPSFTLPIAQVAEHAASAEGASAITQITDAFGINLPLFLAQCLSFTVVVLVLWKFAFKPVLATLDERQRKISDGLKYAEDMRARLAEAEQQTAAQLKEAQTEASKIIDQARQTAKALADREAAAATERANALIAKAESAIQLEHKKMLDEARVEIARLVVATTRQVLARELSDDERSRYNEAASRELSTV